MSETESNSIPPTPNVSPDEGVIPVDRVELIPEEDLRNLLLQTTPKAMRDLDMIEKGVENFFLFNYSPFALAKFEQLQFLKPADLKYFEEKNGFVLYQYLFLSEETKELGLSNVAIRPASRRADQIQKIKSACIAQSAAAFLQFILLRDINLTERRSVGELRDWVQRQYLNTDDKGTLLDIQDSKNLPMSMRNMKSLSVESFLLRNFKIREDILISLISLLTKKPTEIVQFLNQIKTETESVLALEKRGFRPPLLRLHLEFHVIQPSLEELVGDATLDTKKNNNSGEETELEIVYEIFIFLARKILTNLLPGEQSGWIRPSGTDQGTEFIRELKKHPAFTSGKTWDGSDIFIQAFEVLHQSMDSLSSLRKESLINMAFSDLVIRVRESKEPMAIDLASIKIKDSSIQKAGLTKAEVLDQAIERFKSRNDILIREKATGNSPGLIALALENVVPSFLMNKERRTSVHNLIRKNGQLKGIYAFLKDVNEGVDSDVVIDEQIRLSKAIADWEKENERLRLKAAQDSKSIIVKLLEWILGLLGIKISSSPKKDFEPAEEFQPIRQNKNTAANKSGEPEKELPKKKKSLGVLMGPKEKSTLIPAKVQKSIDYVDRRNNGLIWLDEVVSATASPEFGKDKVADLMYYDQKRRYIEIRSMNSVRHVFIRTELESDSAWLDSILEYLENVTAKKPEFAALADTLRKFKEE